VANKPLVSNPAVDPISVFRPRPAQQGLDTVPSSGNSTRRTPLNLAYAQFRGNMAGGQAAVRWAEVGIGESTPATKRARGEGLPSGQPETAGLLMV
jgi:hypothetical protein